MDQRWLESENQTIFFVRSYRASGTNQSRDHQNSSQIEWFWLWLTNFEVSKRVEHFRKVLYAYLLAYKPQISTVEAHVRARQAINDSMSTLGIRGGGVSGELLFDCFHHGELLFDC